MRASIKPFTGSKTGFVVAVAAALCVGALAGPPVARAAAHAVTTIADPRTGKQAHVTKTGKLEVSDGSGAMTVDGTVTAYTYPRSRAFSTWVEVSGASTPFVDKGKKVAITSITVDNSSGDDGEVTLYRQGGTDANCAGGFASTPIWSSRTPADADETSTFPSPLIVSDRCAIFAENLGAGFVYVTVTGYVTG
jgi:hypothetical protein